ncbi:thioredoxin family protein [Nocardioides limicola]|uniref:thioredoxin family protein n=1 Tax=Nocardioides limicola TaxID=2803368 RepID=UPI00193B1417|nr:thioredoxin family protein [Nocardioides sp. DJM-14]
MTTETIVLIGAVAGALAFGGYRAFTDGRFTGTHRVRGGAEEPEQHEGERVLAGTEWADQLGERATLLQFSSAFCAPCRATRRILTEITEVVPGVRHLEIDAEHHLELVRELGIMRTPTTLVLDRFGREVRRAQGAPAKQQVLAALAEV